MAKKREKVHKDFIVSGSTTATFDLTKLAAIYGRKSTRRQVIRNQFAHEMKLALLLTRASEYGFSEARVIVYIENLINGIVRAISGTLRIDQREGLRALYENLHLFSAIFVEDVARLFRDETEVEPNRFLLRCQELNVLVVTLERVFDFNNEQDCFDFREEAREAAQELRTLRERALGTKDLLSSKGFYDGRTIYIGYFIDYRKRVGGQANPQYKKLNAYEPHARRFAAICRYLLMTNINFPRVYRTLKRRPFVFPEFQDWIPEETVNRIELTKVSGGYTFGSYSAFRYMFFSDTPLGRWPYREGYIENNHPAIVDERTYLLIRDHVSGDGIVTTRAEKGEEENEKPEALLDGLIKSKNPKRVVYVRQMFRRPIWYYQELDKDLGATTGEKYSIRVMELDALIRQMLASKLLDVEQVRAVLAQLAEEIIKQRSRVIARLVEIESMKRKALHTLASDIDEGTWRGMNALYIALEREENELFNPQREVIAEEERVLAYNKSLDSLDVQRMAFQDEILFIKALVKEVLFEPLSPHFFSLLFRWRTKWPDELRVLYREVGKAPPWTPGERALVEMYYASDTPQEELLKMLPRRSWESIKLKAQEMELGRRSRHAVTRRKIEVSFQDLEVMRVYGITEDSILCGNRVW